MSLLKEKICKNLKVERMNLKKLKYFRAVA